MTTRIALCGHAGAGKTTFADYLAQTHAFTRKSLAAPVKIIANTVADARGIPNTKADRRSLYQQVGMGGRAVNPAFWLHALEEELGAPESDETRYVIDDVRFPNEAAYLSDVCGFTIVKIDAPIPVCLARLQARDGGASMALFEDASEREVDAIQADLVLPNVTEDDRQSAFRRLDTLLVHALT